MRKRNFWVDIYSPDGLPVWGYPVTCYTEIEAEVAAKKAYRETFGKDAVKRIRADAVDNDLSNCTHAGAYDALKQLYHKVWTAYVSASDEAARLRQIMQEHDEAEEYAKAAAAAGQQDLLDGPDPDERRYSEPVRLEPGKVTHVTLRHPLNVLDEERDTDPTAVVRHGATTRACRKEKRRIPDDVLNDPYVDDWDAIEMDYTQG